MTTRLNYQNFDRFEIYQSLRNDVTVLMVETKRRQRKACNDHGGIQFQNFVPNIYSGKTFIRIYLAFTWHILGI